MTILKQTAATILILFLHVYPAQTANITPSIEITGGVSGVCTDTFVPLPVIAHAYPGSSNAGVLSVQGVGVVFDYKQNITAFFNGPTAYGISPSSYSVAPNTPITATITTYMRPDQVGASYISEVVFDCTTGEVLSLTNTVVSNAVPALNLWGLMFLTLSVLLAGSWMARKKRLKKTNY